MVHERHISSGVLLLVGGALPGLPGLPSAPGRFGPGKSANLFGFDRRKSTNTRMGHAKVPHPGVDLILVHMAAPARSLASAVHLDSCQVRHRTSTYDVVRTPYDIVRQTYDVVLNIVHTISYVRYYILYCTYDIVRLSTS